MKKRAEMVRPVVFIHQGRSFYLKNTVHYAEKICSYVVLIGDEDNSKVAKEHYDMESYISHEYRQFIEYYKHMSTNSYEFELVCFKRYFILYEWMKKQDIYEAVMVDSDVIIFEDLSVFDFKDYEITVAIEEYSGYRWSAGPSCLFIKIDALKELLEYFISVYKNQLELLKQKNQWHIQNGIPGGICDMTLLFLWATHTSRNVYNTYEDKYEGWFDSAFTDSENAIGFQMTTLKFNSVKKIIKRAKKIFFITDQGELKPVYTIHAQGKGKLYIPYLTGRIFREPCHTAMMQIIAFGVGFLNALGK